MPASSELPQRKILQSWKEIASHLGVTIRSAQRWEKESALPVYRHAGSSKAHVFAYSDELQKWLESGGYKRREEETAGSARRGHTWLYAALVAVVVLGLAGIFAWRAGIFPLARVPYAWIIDGTQLKIFDKAEQLCWQKRIPLMNWEFYPSVQDRALIADIDSDGRTEVLVNIVPDNFLKSGGSLLCFEQDGTLRWEFRHGGPRTFGGRTFDAKYIGRSIRSVKVDGKPLILTVSNHHLWYPGQAALLDPKTGRVLEEYWHPGWIYYCLLRDIDGDGNEEALLGTINNPGPGLGHAGLAVLKLPFSKAPRREFAPDAPFKPVTGGGELAYYLFPQPDVDEATGSLPKIYAFWINDFGYLQVIIPVPESGGIIYSLDMKFNVLDCRTSDNYRAVHDRLQREGLLDHSPTAEELSSLKKIVSFAAAPDGNSPSLKNLWKY